MSLSNGAEQRYRVWFRVRRHGELSADIGGARPSNPTCPCHRPDESNRLFLGAALQQSPPLHRPELMMNGSRSAVKRKCPLHGSRAVNRVVPLAPLKSRTDRTVFVSIVKISAMLNESCRPDRPVRLASSSIRPDAAIGAARHTSHGSNRCQVAAR